MSVTQITDDNIDTGIDTSKCIGAIGAMDGSALTNMNAGTSLLKYGFNPAIDTNPVDGVGAIWINTVTGQMFSCTDATTDQNTWTNMGSGTGHVTYTPPVTESFGGIGGGTSSGYNSGGTEVTYIQKFSLTSNGNASHVGNLSVPRSKICGNSSTTHGYTSGGQSLAVTFMDTIDKFSFSTHGTAGDVGNLPSHGQINPASQTDGTASVGYATAGTSAGGVVGIKSKFSFTTDGNSVTVGNITVPRFHASGQSSPYKGYISGGTNLTDIIEEFSFASNVDTFDVADLAIGREYLAEHSSNTYGYVSGGYILAYAQTASVEKFSFSNTVTVSSHGNLSATRVSNTGQSSVTDGYSTGGYTSVTINIIDKFSFVTGGTASDIGNLQTEQSNSCGQQI